ncbi:tripartite tricarboxylate transporter permease [Halomonas sp. KO116]|uniref:tripartite tricarboxylate transporter permease n=1 Tax=Halomonas sp. KO116 TaxID=1504981 RepID=UPI0004E29FA4|nr:tripartite tricarboxylate transporter permease [Halomonas sp. KO116]AJY52334.1 protein of unknown function DUF112 transmembrane [Halomonas sp. KO116]
MFELNVILAGLADAFTLTNLLFVLLGVALGQFVGAVPGLSAPMAIAIAVPFTYVMSPLSAVAFLVGIAKGGTVGGAIPAILLNTPGSPEAAASAMDGYPLAQQGKGVKAMKLSLYASATGDTLSDIVLITVAAPLAVLALMTGPVEIVSLMIFAFSIITGLVGNSMAKGIAAAAFGLLCASVGLDPEHGTPRLEFGQYQLDDGLPLAAVAIGMLAVGEIVRQIAGYVVGGTPTIKLSPDSSNPNNRLFWSEYWSCRYTLLRGSVIGTIIGAIPGVGATAAGFLSYASAKSASKEPESFGKGNIHGLAATESANSAVMGANFIPLLTLGIPGNVTAALIIGALIIQGIQPGPFLFRDQGQLIYGLFGAMMIANLLNLLVGQFGIRLWARVVRAPASIIFSVALLLCIVGVYLTTGGIFGVKVMILFAAISYLMQAFGFSVVAFIIAFFLGPQLERSLSQALIILNGNPRALLDHPVALALIMLAVFFTYWVGIRKKKKVKVTAKSDC